MMLWQIWDGRDAGNDMKDKKNNVKAVDRAGVHEFLLLAGKMTLPALALASCGGRRDLPNIIYVFPDQFRGSAMAFWNEPEYAGFVGWTADPVQTPNLDRFAGEGLVLSDAVSTCPLSSPYRGMFLTGMYPERSGVTLNCMAERPESTLDPEAVCISDVLAAAGYSCGYIGKFHAEFPTPDDPENPGHYVSDRRPEWDTYTPPGRRHGYSWWYSYGTFDEHRNPHYWDTEGHRHAPHEFSVKHETDKAIEYLRNENGERRAGAPFFLTVAYNPPHAPYESLDDCMEEEYDLYRDKPLSELYVRPNADTAMSKAPSARYYFANVTAVDREFGRILDELKRLGLEKNTIVVFTSDHGETMCSHGTSDPKNSIYAESFNVPFIVRWPGRIAHRVDKIMLSTTDIMPTLLSLAGLENSVPHTAEGHDLSEAFLGKPCERPDAVLYMRNVNGQKDSLGLVHGFFPAARGVKTDRYSMEISITRDTTLSGVKIFDNLEDPYQMDCIRWEENRELFLSLCGKLMEKLEESRDIWLGDNILDKILDSCGMKSPLKSGTDAASPQI